MEGKDKLTGRKRKIKWIGRERQKANVGKTVGKRLAKNRWTAEGRSERVSETCPFWASRTRHQTLTNIKVTPDK